MTDGIFFMFIDMAAQYFILFEAMVPVRSNNASEFENPLLKPN